MIKMLISARFIFFGQTALSSAINSELTKQHFNLKIAGQNDTK